MSMQEDQAVATYRELARIPSLTSARITNSDGSVTTVTSEWSQRDLERGSTVKFNRSFVILGAENKTFDNMLPVSDTTELHEEMMSSFSACGKYKAVVRQVKNKKGEDQQYMEIWTQQSKIRNVNLTVVDKHGKFYSDGEFGCLKWSSDSQMIVYIAEKKQPKTTSYFDRKSCQAEEDTDPSTEIPIKGDQFLFRDDWGETLIDKCYPVICTFEVATETVNVLEGVPVEISPAQASWSQGDAGIVFSALYHEPYKLGAIYCDNRRSAVFYLNLKEKKCELLSADDKCCRSPRCSPDGSKVIYLQNDVGGPHQHCKQLMMYDWATRASTVIVDLVHRPKDAESFPGLFVNSLPQRCWSGDIIYLDTIWRSTQKILSINTSTKQVTVISENDVYSSWMVVDVKGSLLLARRGTPNKSGQLVICDLSKKSTKDDWFILDDNHVDITDITWKLITLPQSDGLDVEGILLSPSNSSSEKLPLVIFPHGGPHSVITANYYVLLTFLCKMNFIVVCVNYRGSIGFGQDSIISLPGKVGSQDVHDVHLLAEHVLKEGYGDPDRVIVTGGSHGGFLSLHMIGQYPDFYKVCAVRNPVCNIAVMLGYSDIPDWCYVEAGQDFSDDIMPSSETYKAMLEKSPIIHLPKVKAPTLFLIGKEDARVPPKQGEDYYKKLKARGVKTKLLHYPENNHGLLKLDAESDCFINIYRWFKEHL